MQRCVNNDSGAYDTKENEYRNHLRDAMAGVPGALRPRQQVIGDLRYIRNNLIHQGIAKKSEAGDCKILRWFERAERMQMRLGHVLDFLNQMDVCTNPTPFGLMNRGGQASGSSTEQSAPGRPGQS